MSAAPSLLSSTTGVGRLSLSASGFVAKVARGFQVLRIDGYSCTKNLPAGAAAYERPAETSVFTYAGRVRDPHSSQSWEPEFSWCGPASFITRKELEARHERLIVDDCLAIRCDVGVAELECLTVAPKQHSYTRHDDDVGGGGGDDDDWDGRRRRQPIDDREYIRRCLARRRT